MLPTKHPLLDGVARPHGISVPDPLWKRIEESAQLDGFTKLSPYLCHLLIAALEQRERERNEERKRK